jgi:hypothetical protein
MTSSETRHREADTSYAVDLITPLAADFKPGDDPRALAAAIMAKLTGAGWRRTNAAAVPWQAPARHRDPEPDPGPAEPTTAAKAVELARQLSVQVAAGHATAEAERIRERRAAGQPLPPAST